MKDSDLKPLLSRGESERIWSALSELRYIFSHTLLRDTAYEMQLKARLRGLHKLAGDTMVRLYPDDKTKLADIADHYERAEEWKEAGEYLLKAADWAREQHYNQAALGLYNRMFALQQSHQETATPEMLITAMLSKGYVLRLTGKLRDTGELYQNALELSKGLDDRRYIAKILCALGEMHYFMGELNKGLDLFEKSLCIGQELRDKPSIFYAVSNKGLVYQIRGDYDQALECHWKSLSIASELGDKEKLFHSILRIGALFQRRGDYDRALENYQRAQIIADELRDKIKTAIILGDMGWMCFHCGDYDRALEFNNKRLSIAEEFGDKIGIWLTFRLLGYILTEKGDYNRALAFYQKELSVAIELGYMRQVSESLGNIGVIYLELGEYRPAEEMLLKAVSIFRELSYAPGLAYYMPFQARAVFAQADFSRASELCNEALELARELKDLGLTIHAQIISNMINFAAALDDATRKTAVQSFHALLSEVESDEQRSTIHYELTSMHRTLNQPDQAEYHQLEAIRLYEELYAKIPKYKFKKHLEELRDNG